MLPTIAITCCKSCTDYRPVYSQFQEQAISSEFKRAEGQCYLEHAGATLYSEKQIGNVLSDLGDNLYANPHARSTASKVTEDSVDQIRYDILSHFRTNVDEYSVIFTAGCTAALKLVAETFDYQNGHFAYLEDNHTSVLGMREYASSSKLIRHDNAFDILSKHANNYRTSNSTLNNKNSLFVYPAQCNFSATKYPLSWIELVQAGALNEVNEMQSGNWYCCLDAASYVSTNMLDLSVYKPDFICISFYKIFGYPTGLGALLVKNTSASVLVKKYYGGGTVLMALSLENIAVPRKVIHERFEDGTIPFLSILSLKHGFETLKRLNINMELISRHTFNLAQYVYGRLSMLHHFSGGPVTFLYHDTNFESRHYQGGIVNFNLLRPSGEYIGYAEVLHIANLYGIHLRTGCFCNPGSCQRHLQLTTDDVKFHFESGHVCGDQNDLIDGSPTGSVRVSFGYMSTKQDADEFLTMIEDCFAVKPIIRKMSLDFEVITRKFHEKFSVSKNTQSQRSKSELISVKAKTEHVASEFISNNNEETVGILEELFVYPIKSCAPFSVINSWELCSTGMKFDRQWMIVNHLGVCLTQKRNTRLCMIKPYIDIESNRLKLTFKGMKDVFVPLTATSEKMREIFPCQSKVCGDHVLAWDCGNEVADWLSEALDKPGLKLVRQSTNQDENRMKTKLGEMLSLSLTNEAQFLLINRSSVDWLLNRIPMNDFHDTAANLVRRFRPNFVIDFGEPFVENRLQEIKFGNTTLQSGGCCTRCQMICIDQNTGEKSVEPLRTLSKEFNGKISFGIYLKQQISSKYDDKIILKSLIVGK